MLVLLCSWIIIALVFFSWGSMTSLVWHQLNKQENKFSVFDTFWIGICTVGVLLSILSLFIPISFYLLVGFVAIAAIYASLHVKQIGAKVKDVWKELTVKPIEFKISLVLSLFAISLFALTTPLLYDEGLYHLQTMMWSEQYSVIPGLGNLHGRLAFNSNFLLLSTLFNYHPSHFTPFFTINSLCLIVFTVWMLLRIRASKELIQKGVLVFILMLCIFSFGIYLSSTSTDILAHILIVYLLLNSILEKEAVQKKTLLFFILPIFCVTLKLSSALIVLFTVYSLIYLIRSKAYKKLGGLVALGLVIGLPWIIRFVILSGYLIYPFPAIDIFSFDWKIPLEMVQLEKDLAFVWPIAPDMEVNKVLAMSLSEWVPLWFARLSVFNLVLYSLVAISALIILIRCKLAKQYKSIFLAWGIAFLGCLFGFFSAPDPRFSFSFIICAGLIPLLLLDPLLGSRKRISKLAYRIVPLNSFILIIGLFGLSYIAYDQAMFYQTEDKEWSTLLYEPQSIDYKKNEQNSLFVTQETGNIEISYPDNGNQCFDQPLPCIPYPNSNLDMRGDRIEDGFRIKGVN